MTAHIIPIDRLSPQALRGAIREFISRDGTDYGEREASPEESYKQVAYRLKSGSAVLIYDDETETTNIFPADSPLLRQLEQCDEETRRPHG
jgi:uncharacterized protein YheU (UPF0270 family)